MILDSNSSMAGWFSERIVKGRVSCLCVWVNCHVSPFNSIVIETIESTEAGSGSNAIEVELLLPSIRLRYDNSCVE